MESERTGRNQPAPAESFERHRPLVTVVLGAIAAFLVVLAIHAPELGPIWRNGFSAALLAGFGLGMFYTQLFEYGFHRFVMHRRIKGLLFIWKGHLDHHRVFYGENFQSDDPEDLRYIAPSWFKFPSLYLLHYLALSLFLETPMLISMLAGILVHYLAFEVTHWYMHVRDNWLDAFLVRIPVLGPIRDYQIRHHRLHHDIPAVDFGFMPPYIGDWVGGTMQRAEAPLPSPASDGAAVAQPSRRSRKRLALSS